MPKDYKPHQKFCNSTCAGLSRAEQTARLGRQRKGIKYSVEIRGRMSLAASKRKKTSYTRGAGGYRTDLGHYVRSSWEANIARILQHEGISYQYEPTTFVLQKSDGSIIKYTPDFLTDHYIEVKGWWDEKSQLKRQLMVEQYPSIIIEYITESEYLTLQQGYKDELNWQHGRS